MMASGVLLDNDVLLKTACYSLVRETLKATTVDDIPPAILGVARFVVQGRIARGRNVADPERASAMFEEFLKSVSMVEPKVDELELAAEFEAEAMRRNVDLDGGESQLLAILAIRGAKLLITGDKRAIAAMGVVASEEAVGRVACLEQLIAHIVAMVGAADVRKVVCSEPKIDKAVTICLSCGERTSPTKDDLLAALASYIAHTNRTAPGILLPGPNLAALAA